MNKQHYLLNDAHRAIIMSRPIQTRQARIVRRRILKELSQQLLEEENNEKDSN